MTGVAEAQNASRTVLESSSGGCLIFSRKTSTKALASWTEACFVCKSAKYRFDAAVTAPFAEKGTNAKNANGKSKRNGTVKIRFIFFPPWMKIPLVGGAYVYKLIIFWYTLPTS